MQRLEVSSAVRHTYGSLGVKQLINKDLLLQERNTNLKFPKQKEQVLGNVSEVNFGRKNERIYIEKRPALIS